MVVSQGDKAVAPRHIHVEPHLLASETELVVAVVSAEIEAVVVVDNPVGLGVYIEEVVARCPQQRSFLRKRTNQRIYVCPSCRNYKRSLVLHNRSLHRKTRRNRTDAAFDVILLHVAVFHRNV